MDFIPAFEMLAACPLFPDFFLMFIFKILRDALKKGKLIVYRERTILWAAEDMPNLFTQE